MAQAAGDPQARVVPRPGIRAGTVFRWALIGLVAGAATGWWLHSRWGIPGGVGAEMGALEQARAIIVIR
jgi:hypothetical protein